VQCGDKWAHTQDITDDRDESGDRATLARIHDLVAEEKQLRAQPTRGRIGESEENARLRAVESELDQCWDLLGQRRALRETGGDPDAAAVRPAEEVERYSG